MRNEYIIIDEDTVGIIVTWKKDKYISLVDYPSFEYLKQYDLTWSACDVARNGEPYVFTNGNSKIGIGFNYLHQFIMKPLTGMKVDHINHKPLDNRRCMLREATHKQNHQNRKVSKNNTSGHVGVTWNQKSKKWQANIVVDGEFKYLGLYKDLNDAIEARKQAEIKYFPFSKYNLRNIV